MSTESRADRLAWSLLSPRQPPPRLASSAKTAAALLKSLHHNYTVLEIGLCIVDLSSPPPSYQEYCLSQINDCMGSRFLSVMSLCETHPSSTRAPLQSVDRRFWGAAGSTLCTRPAYSVHSCERGDTRSSMMWLTGASPDPLVYLAGGRALLPDWSSERATSDMCFHRSQGT